LEVKLNIALEKWGRLIKLLFRIEDIGAELTGGCYGFARQRLNIGERYERLCIYRMGKSVVMKGMQK
jgi:hypothetical protein